MNIRRLIIQCAFSMGQLGSIYAASNPCTIATPERQVDAELGCWLEGANTECPPGSPSVCCPSHHKDKGVTHPSPDVPVPPSPKPKDNDADPINFATGEFYISYEDLRIPGPGMDIVWTRKYRSRVNYPEDLNYEVQYGSGTGAVAISGAQLPHSSFGTGWDFNYNMSVQSTIDCGTGPGSRLIVRDGNTRRDVYTVPTGEDGVYVNTAQSRKLVRGSGGSLTLYFPDGGRWVFENAPSLTCDATHKPFWIAKITDIYDRHNNGIHISYVDNGGAPSNLIQSVTNDSGNTLYLFYYPSSSGAAYYGRIKTAQCTINGHLYKCEYTYDFDDEPNKGGGDLRTATVGITSTDPGRTTTYTYSKGMKKPNPPPGQQPLDDVRRNHNLLTITDPKLHVLTNHYSDTDDENNVYYDRVIQQTWADKNIDIWYPADGAAVVRDRNGNLTKYVYTEGPGRLLSVQTEYNTTKMSNGQLIKDYPGPFSIPEAELDFSSSSKIRPTDPDCFVTEYQYSPNDLVSAVYSGAKTATSTFVPSSTISYDYDITNTDMVKRMNLLKRTLWTPGGLEPTIETWEYNSSVGCGCSKGFPTLYKGKRSYNNQSAPAAIINYIYDPDTGDLTEIQRELASSGPNAGKFQVDTYAYDERGRLTDHWHPNNQLAGLTPDPTLRRRDHYEYEQDVNGSDTGPLKKVTIDYTASGASVTGLNLKTIYTSDDFWRPKTIKDPSGHTTDMTWSVTGRVRTVTTPPLRDATASQAALPRRTTEFTYDSLDDLSEIAVEYFDETGNPGDGSKKYKKTFQRDDAQNKVTKILEDVEGSRRRETTFEYDNNRNITTIRKGQSNRVGHSADDDKNTVLITYDTNDLPYRVSRAPGYKVGDASGVSTTEYAYDANHLVTEMRQGIEDTAPRITTFERYADGTIHKVIDALGNETVYEYGTDRRLAAQQFNGSYVADVSGSDGNITLSRTEYDLDGLNNVTHSRKRITSGSSAVPIGDGWQDTYNLYSYNSQLMLSLDDNGHVIGGYNYDRAYRLQKQHDGSYDLTNAAAPHNTMEYSYDLNSRVSSIVHTERSDVRQAGGMPAVDQFTEAFEYDNVGNLIKYMDNVSNVTRFDYDSLGKLAIKTDPNNHQVKFDYDKLSRLTDVYYVLESISCSHPDPIHNQLIWDDSDRLVSRIDGNYNQTNYNYDPLDRLIRTQYADLTEENTVYDQHDLARTVTDANGTVQTLTYDLKNQLLQRNIARAAGVLGETFQTFTYDGAGRILSAQNDFSSITERKYDSLSRLLSETQDGHTVTASYDGVGNMLSLVYPSPNARTINYTYNAKNRISTVSDSVAGTLAANYYVGNNLEWRDFADGSRWELTYDGISNVSGDYGFRQITKSKHWFPELPDWIEERNYKYDAAQNQVSEAELIGGVTRTRGYEYDELNRLTHSSLEGTSDATDYFYDSVGNRTNVVSPSVAGSLYEMADYDPPADLQMNQYTSTPFSTVTHDAAGNPTEEAFSVFPNSTCQYAYDWNNRLTQSASGSIVYNQLRYDALGRLVTNDITHSTHEFVNDTYFGSQLVSRVNSLTGATNSIVYADNQIDDAVAEKSSGTESFLHQDRRGSVTAVSDEANVVAGRNGYGDFGEFTGHTGRSSTLLFTGRTSIRGIVGHGIPTLYDFRTRQYDTRTGRFLQRDSIGNWGDPLEMGNGYTYVGNNPLRWTDRFGLDVYGDGGGPEGLYQVELAVQGADNLLHDPEFEDTRAFAGEFARALLGFGFRAVGASQFKCPQTIGQEFVNWALGSMDRVNDLTIFAMTSALFFETKPLEMIERGFPALRTEIVERWMSKQELEAMKETNLLRGGRPGTHFVTDNANKDALRARQRMALPQTPQVRVRFKVNEGHFGPPSKVAPKYNMPGGGLERTAEGPVGVTIIAE